MKIKIILLAVLLVLFLGTSLSVSAMTETERQALIVQLQTQINALIQQVLQLIAQQQGSSTWCHTFNSNLGYANSGAAEVFNLHLLLMQEGISYSPDGLNIYSVPTKDAVLQLQARYGISQTGYFGIATRTRLNQIYGCGNVYNPNACTSFNYSNWGTCYSGVQTRTKTSSYPSGCTGGNPITSQLCGSAGNTCTSFSYSSWGSCYSGAKTRTATGVPAGCTGGNPVIAQSCAACNAGCVTTSAGTYAIASCTATTATQCYAPKVCRETYSNDVDPITGLVVQTLKGALCTSATPVFTTISVTPITVPLIIGGTRTLTAQKLDQNGSNMPSTPSITVTWLSSTPRVATVDYNGLVTAVSAGTTIITAYNGSVSGIASVTVSSGPVLTTITIAPSAATLVVGGLTQQLTATKLDQSGVNMPSTPSITVTWATKQTAVATVSTSGVVRAVSAGTAYITASSGSVTGSSTITVSNTPVLSSIIISPAIPNLTVDLIVGAYQDLQIQKLNQSNLPITASVSWSSSDTETATVSTSGRVTGKRQGVANITASSGSGSGLITSNTLVVTVRCNASCTVSGLFTYAIACNGTIVDTCSPSEICSLTHVPVPILGGGINQVPTGAACAGQTLTTISVTPITVPLSIGGTQQLYFEKHDQSGITMSPGTVIWSSDAPAVTVNNSGLVTGVSVGTANITAHSGSIYSNPSTVTVSVGPLTVNIKANDSEGPVTVPYNSEVALSWTVTGPGLISCSASNGWGGTKTNGPETVTATTQSQTYVLTCTNGPSSFISDSVVVNVRIPSCTASFSPTSTGPITPDSGAVTSLLTWTPFDTNPTICRYCTGPYQDQTQTTLHRVDASANNLQVSFIYPQYPGTETCVFTPSIGGDIDGTSCPNVGAITGPNCSASLDVNPPIGHY